MASHTIQELHQFQALPLSIKIAMTKDRIRGWVNEYGEDGVYISFSGGKDSTVLLDIARQDYPDLKAMFVDVPTQFPELRDFVNNFSNVDIIKPSMGFAQVVDKYGFPLISKEVSECVYGARKYLTQLKSEMNASTNERTNERMPYAQFYRKVCGLGEYKKSPCKKEIRSGRFNSEACNNVGNANERTNDSGEYP